MNEQPLLSLCIPTYNRSSILCKCLESIVCQNRFNGDVEIVISDNASTDDTEKIATQYSNRYPNIKYFKNDQNIKDGNYPISLDRAKGNYVKLLNDNCILEEGALDYLTSKLQSNYDNKTPVFFTNNFVYTRSKNEEIVCNSLDSLVAVLSTYVTAISCFGAWKEHWLVIKDKMKYSSLKLPQDDWIYQIMEMEKKCILYDKCYYSVGNVGIRRGYNWFEVHLDNYYRIMQPYIERGLVCSKTLYEDKIHLLKHFTPNLIQIYCVPYKNDIWQYDTNDTFVYFWKHYKTVPLFYLYLFLYPFYVCFYFPFSILKWIAKRITKRMGLYNKIKGIKDD